MAKTVENARLVNKLPHNDPECVYVNKMMEMSADFFREMHRTRSYQETLNGIVPTCKLPPDYSFGNINCIAKDKICFEKTSAKSGLNGNSQSSSNSNSTIRMDVDDHDNEISQTDENIKMIETVRGDLILSDEDEDHNTDATPYQPNNIGNSEENERLLFETIDACSKKIPNLNSMHIFQKLYKTNKSDSAQNANTTKNELPDNASGDTEPFEDNNDASKDSKNNLLKFIDLLSVPTYKKNLATSFQTICNLVNSNKRKPARTKTEEKSVTPSKLLKLSRSLERKKDGLPHDTKYQIKAEKNIYELSINILPELTKDGKLNHTLKFIKEAPKEVPAPTACTKPKYVTQDSQPFIKSESTTKKDIKTTEENPVDTIPQTSSNNSSIENNQNPLKKPEAAAKQFFAQSTNYSNYNNNAKVAIVTGKVNKTQSNWHNNNNNNNNNINNNNNKSDVSNKPAPLPSLQINSVQTYQKQQPNQQSRTLDYKDSNENYADESKVVQGLMAMNKMRTFFKNDFITRMRNLEIDKWLKEVVALKEKAFNCKGQLDYAPHIMVYIRKNLFYNYSLEVKSDYGASHKTYLENAAIIKQSCSDINQIYSEHEKDILDKNSQRLWNINLVKNFTLVMCHRLSAILQYRAFRNVSEDCRKIHETLLRSGVIDKNDHTNSVVTDNHQHSSSPFSVLSSYSPGQVSARNSSPRICNSDNHITLLSNNTGTSSTTLTAEMKAKLQRYINHTTIINSSYNDWVVAEKLHIGFCNRSSRHDDSWREFEWKIIEKTGGVVISSVDESIPFVIKYLEGYINFMSEFMKHKL